MPHLISLLLPQHNLSSYHLSPSQAFQLGYMGPRRLAHLHVVQEPHEENRHREQEPHMLEVGHEQLAKRTPGGTASPHLLITIRDLLQRCC